MKKNLVKKYTVTMLTILCVFAMLPLSVFADGTDEPDYIVSQSFDSLEIGASKGTGFNGYVSNNLGVAGVIAVCEEEDGNKYLRYDKTCEGGGQIPCYTDLDVKNGSLAVSDDFVIEFRFVSFGALPDTTLVQGRKYNEKLQMQDFLFIKNGKMTDGGGNILINSIIVGKWYSVAIAVHETDRNFDVYVDGEWLFTSDFLNSNAKAEWDYTCIRALNITGMNTVGSVGMDDLKIYNATIPILPETEPEQEPEEEEPEKPKTEKTEEKDKNRYTKFTPVFTAEEPQKKTVPDGNELLFNESRTDKIYIAAISGVALLAVAGCLMIKKKI